jgi:hypothetical protein
VPEVSELLLRPTTDQGLDAEDRRRELTFPAGARRASRQLQSEGSGIPTYGCARGGGTTRSSE